MFVRNSCFCCHKSITFAYCLNKNTNKIQNKKKFMAIRSKQLDSKKLKKLRDRNIYDTIEVMASEIGLSAHTVGNILRTGWATGASEKKIDIYLAPQTEEIPA
jgi:hypothetical protein